jgi:hypothetical protein
MSVHRYTKDAHTTRRTMPRRLLLLLALVVDALATEAPATPPPASPAPSPPPFPPPKPPPLPLPPHAPQLVRSTKNYEKAMEVGLVALIGLAVVLFGFLLPIIVCCFWGVGGGALFITDECQSVPLHRHDALLKSWKTHAESHVRAHQVRLERGRDCENGGRVIVAPPAPVVWKSESRGRGRR